MNLRTVQLSVWCALFPFFLFAQTEGSKADSAKKQNPITKQPKPYTEIISSKAITDNGLFSIHQIEDKYFFELPDSLLGADLLIVNRIVKAPAGLMGAAGFVGDQIGQKIVRFERGPDYKLFLKELNFFESGSDSTGNGMGHLVENASLQPIIGAFDIKCFGKDSAVVIDVTDYVNGDNPVLFFENKARFKIGGIQAGMSYVKSVRSFPVNIEINTVKTYSGSGADATNRSFELNSSIVLLPKDRMKSRAADERVGYFFSRNVDYDANPQRVELSKYATRWRLEPRDEDRENYLRGELVEPKKPIVYYIDPATPKKWIPYLVQGVNDWQKAFEKAGFKKAIYALEAPVNDPDFSLYDARNNAIIYKPSDMANASGPHIHDPRTGEILETHIHWYHNVIALIHDWYLVQAGAVDPRARKMQYDDNLMGQLIRFVSSHEVGHTLGLAHNFGSSATVPVDSLRSKTYLDKYGHTPSIMDYARFNYVAQPEDGITEKGIFPRIGMYDEWAIEWGYRWFPPSKFQSKEEEKIFLNKWVTNRLSEDNRYVFGPQNVNGPASDPRNQSEDLGDNAMKAGYYGIKNLKRILPNLADWTKEPGEDYSHLKNMNTQVLKQYERYINHVVSNIGLFTWTYRTNDEAGNVVGFVPREKQKEAVRFLHKELFETPEWLMNKQLFSKIGGYGITQPLVYQKPVIKKIVSAGTYQRLLFFKGQEPQKAYSFDALLTDLETGIWKELKTRTPVDFCRRNLQKAYAVRLIELLNPDKNPDAMEKMGLAAYITTDFPLIIRNHVSRLLTQVNGALALYKDPQTREHLIFIRDKLAGALKDFKEGASIQEKAGTDSKPNTSLHIEVAAPGQTEFFTNRNCWKELP